MSCVGRGVEGEGRGRKKQRWVFFSVLCLLHRSGGLIVVSATFSLYRGKGALEQVLGGEKGGSLDVPWSSRHPFARLCPCYSNNKLSVFQRVFVASVFRGGRALKYARN